MVALIVIGLVVLGAIGVGFFALSGKIDRDQAKAEQNADTILNNAFDGRADVTFPLHMRTLKPETVLLGARTRGYKLTHQIDGQYGPTSMMFEKVTDQPA